MKTHFLLILSLLIWACSSTSAIEQRNLLQQKADMEQLKSFLACNNNGCLIPTTKTGAHGTVFRVTTSRNGSGGAKHY